MNFTTATTTTTQFKIERRMPPAPMRLNPLHFDTDKSIKEIDDAITEVLNAAKVQYTAPATITTYFIDDTKQDINSEIHILKDTSVGSDLTIVEFCRFGGDGFKNLALFNRVYARLCPEADVDLEDNNFEDEPEMPTDNFNGLPLDHNAYDDLCNLDDNDSDDDDGYTFTTNLQPGSLKTTLKYFQFEPDFEPHVWRVCRLIYHDGLRHKDPEVVSALSDLYQCLQDNKYQLKLAALWSKRSLESVLRALRYLQKEMMSFEDTMDVAEFAERCKSYHKE